MKKEFKFDEPAVGTDAEFFLVKPDGSPVSVEGLLGGEKGRPKACAGGGYLEDCVAVEINPDPVPFSIGSSRFIANIRRCMNAVDVEASKLDLSAYIEPQLLFQKEQLQSSQANVSGCAVSYNAWSLKRFAPVDLSKTQYRFASGDLHLSWPDVDEDKYYRVNVARAMDILIGLAEVAHTPAGERMNWYGQAGIHRPTPYGVEYKSASNFWLKSDASIKRAYEHAVGALYLAQNYMRVGANALAFENEKARVVSIRETWDSASAYDMLSDFGYSRWPS